MRLRRRPLALLTALLAVAVPAGVPAQAKKQPRCKRGAEKAGCKLPLGDSYVSKKGAEIALLSRGFNFKDVAASGSCTDGRTRSWVFDIGNAQSVVEKAARVGQTQRFDASSTWISSDQDELPTTLAGSVTFTSAKQAKLTATAGASFPSDAGPAAPCTAKVELTLKRVVESKLPG